MGLNCGCPLGNSIGTITEEPCKESFGQLQKVIFQRLYATAAEGGVTLNGIASDEVTLKATYTALLTAADSTKMVVSPYIQNPTSTPGDMKTFGGGNQTLGGIPIVTGIDPTAFEGIIYEEAQSTIAQMKPLMCENLGVWLIDEYGNIACQKIESGGSPVTVTYRPFPIRQLFIGDKNLGGLEEPDSNAIKWNFPPGWSNKFCMVGRDTLDFDPLTDLVNA